MRADQSGSVHRPRLAGLRWYLLLAARRQSLRSPLLIVIGGGVDSELKNAFQVLSLEKSLTLYTKNEINKEEWIKALQDAIEALFQSQPHLRGNATILLLPSKLALGV